MGRRAAGWNADCDGGEGEGAHCCTALHCTALHCTAHTHTRTHARMHTHTHTHTRSCRCMCVRARVHVHVWVFLSGWPHLAATGRPGRNHRCIRYIYIVATNVYGCNRPACIVATDMYLRNGVQGGKKAAKAGSSKGSSKGSKHGSRPGNSIEYLEYPTVPLRVPTVP